MSSQRAGEIEHRQKTNRLRVLGNGEASGQEHQRARDKGQAKVQENRCTRWLKKAEASRRKKEEREAKRWKQKLQAQERPKNKEKQWLLEQLERFLPEEGERRKERA